MLTEFDVRNELNEIALSEAHPIRKARRLIAVAGQLRHQALRLSEGARIMSRDGNDEQADRLNQRRQRSFDLVREVLDHARNHLAAGASPAVSTTNHAARFLS